WIPGRRSSSRTGRRRQGALRTQRRSSSQSRGSRRRAGTRLDRAQAIQASIRCSTSRSRRMIALSIANATVGCSRRNVWKSSAGIQPGEERDALQGGDLDPRFVHGLDRAVYRPPADLRTRGRRLASVEAETSLYEAVGGMGFFETLVGRFYAEVATDPVLRRLYPGDDL